MWRPHPNLGSTIDPQTPTQNPPLLVFVSSCLFQLVLRSPSNPQTPPRTPPSSLLFLSLISCVSSGSSRHKKHQTHLLQQTAHGPLNEPSQNTKITAEVTIFNFWLIQRFNFINKTSKNSKNMNPSVFYTSKTSAVLLSKSLNKNLIN